MLRGPPRVLLPSRPGYPDQPAARIRFQVTPSEGRPGRLNRPTSRVTLRPSQTYSFIEFGLLLVGRTLERLQTMSDFVQRAASIVIYTDGGCDPNPGPGGWAAVLMFRQRSKEIYGGFIETTNNRMEIFCDNRRTA